jgi:hypothetical protein
MKKMALLLAVSVCVLTPSTAHANDGGFWDMLFRWDPKFMGFGTDFHLACLDASGHRIKGCEEFFRQFKHLRHPSEIAHVFDFAEIKHEFDFRVSFMLSYGDRLSDLPAADPKQADSRKIYAWKLLGVYHYHFNPQWEIGVAAGAIPIYGENVELFWRGIVTPVSVIYSPAGAKVLYFRFEESYITNQITGASLGHPLSAFANNGEWNFSATVGFDLRRIGKMKVANP